jgi:hypothetical protein
METNDKRCPCFGCLVQAVCTDYCTKFHHYRRLVLAEVDFFMSQCICDYKEDIVDGSRMMSQIQRDLTTAYNRTTSPELQKEYFIIKDNLEFLDMRFGQVIENSRSANRGVSERRMV